MDEYVKSKFQQQKRTKYQKNRDEIKDKMNKYDKGIKNDNVSRVTGDAKVLAQISRLKFMSF